MGGGEGGEMGNVAVKEEGNQIVKMYYELFPVCLHHNKSKRIVIGHKHVMAHIYH